MMIRDNVIAFYGSCGVPHECRIHLSPDVNRCSDEWFIDPTTNITCNGGRSFGSESPPIGIWLMFLGSDKVVLDADYDGAFDGPTPLDKITAANFIATGISPPTPVNLADDASLTVGKTLHLESFNGIVGRHDRFNLTSKLNGRFPVNFHACAIIVDDRPITGQPDQFFDYVMTRRSILMTPYFDSNKIMAKLELETDE